MENNETWSKKDTNKKLKSLKIPDNNKYTNNSNSYDFFWRNGISDTGEQNRLTFK
jgi:hypothetical protein